MLEIMKVYKKEIEDYCVENNLSTNKVFASAMYYNEKYVILQRYEYVEGRLCYIDETPLPHTLEIYLENGKLRFVQTEHTHELRADCADRVPVPQMAFA
jgi:tRNA(Ile)-lysidine synthase TilS/MesJ